MHQRSLGKTGIRLSEIGFGVWTVSTGWWGTFTEDEACALLRAAHAAGVTFFNTSNVYGEDGYGEKLVRDALADVRDDIVVATTFGYDVAAERTGSGHKERPHDWSRDNIVRSLEDSLRNLGRDRIDVWQLHNPRMDALTDEALWNVVADLKRQGMIGAVGPSIGPRIGWRDEGLFAIEHCPIDFIHHIYNVLEQEPGREFTARAAERGIGVLVRVPHSSGLLEDAYTLETTFDANDHRSHRKREWLVEGLQKVDALRYLTERRDATMGQVALKWLFADPAVTCVQPNLYNAQQIAEFCSAAACEDLSADELARIDELYRDNFGVVPEPVAAG